MAFQFAYNHILNLKEKEKDQAYLELGQILRKKEEIMVEHNLLVQNRDNCLKRWELANETTYISEIQQRNEYMAYLNRKITKSEEQLMKVEKEVATKKSELLAKQRDEKTWNHLRDKSLEEYVHKQKKLEQDTMDEMAVIRHYHQSLSV